MNLCQTGVFVRIVGAPGNVEMLILFFRASFMTKTVPCGNELHKFLIWDTAGQERVSVHVVGFLGKILRFLKVSLYLARLGCK